MNSKRIEPVVNRVTYTNVSVNYIRLQYYYTKLRMRLFKNGNSKYVTLTPPH